MIALFCLCLALFVSPFKSKRRLEAENAALRHQLIILRRKVRGRVRLSDGDRLFFIQLYRWFPTILKAITIVRPETLVRWHRAGFRRYWRWKSRSLGGRPQIDADLRALIRRMSVDTICSSGFSVLCELREPAEHRQDFGAGRLLQQRLVVWFAVSGLSKET
jgi:hypothetical protein